MGNPRLSIAKAFLGKSPSSTKPGRVLQGFRPVSAQPSRDPLSAALSPPIAYQVKYLFLNHFRLF